MKNIILAPQHVLLGVIGLLLGSNLNAQPTVPTVTQVGSDFRLTWTGQSGTWMGVDRSYASNSCPEGQCYENIYQGGLISTFTDNNLNDGVAYSYKVYDNGGGNHNGYSSPMQFNNSSSGGSIGDCPAPTISSNMTISFGSPNCWYQLQKPSEGLYDICQGIGNSQALTQCGVLTAGNYSVKVARTDTNPWQNLDSISLPVMQNQNDDGDSEGDTGETIQDNPRVTIDGLCTHRDGVTSAEVSRSLFADLCGYDEWVENHSAYTCPYNSGSNVGFQCRGPASSNDEDDSSSGGNGQGEQHCVPGASEDTGAPRVCTEEINGADRKVLSWSHWTERTNNATYRLTRKTNNAVENYSVANYMTPNSTVLTQGLAAEFFVFEDSQLNRTYILENETTGERYNVMVGCDPSREVVEFPQHQGGYEGWCAPGSGITNRIYVPPNWQGAGRVELGDAGEDFSVSWTNTGSTNSQHTEFDISASRSLGSAGYGSLTIDDMDATNTVMTAVGGWEGNGPIGKTHVQSIIWLNSGSGEDKAPQANCNTSFANLTNAQIESRKSIDVTLVHWADASIRNSYFNSNLPARTQEVRMDDYPDYRFFRRFPGDLCEKASYFILGTESNGEGGNVFGTTPSYVEINVKNMLTDLIDRERIEFTGQTTPILGGNAYDGGEDLFDGSWKISSMGWEAAGANADASVAGVGNSSGVFTLDCYSIPRLDGTNSNAVGVRQCVDPNPDDESDAGGGVETEANWRSQSMDQIIDGFEAYAQANGSYRVLGGGWNSDGQGWFGFDNNVRYPTSVHDVLVDGGYMDAPMMDQLYRDSTSTVGDFLVYVCKGRVGLFSRHGSSENHTKAEDLAWWNSNSCPRHPLDSLGASYFKLSADLSDLESVTSDRARAMRQAMNALESFGEENGTYSVTGSGWNNGGQGWFFYDGNDKYTTSVADALTAAGHLLLLMDPLHVRTNAVTGDYLTYRCKDRIGLFSRHGTGSESTSSADANWWSSNGCTTFPTERMNANYFIVSKPI